MPQRGSERERGGRMTGEDREKRGGVDVSRDEKIGGGPEQDERRGWCVAGARYRSRKRNVYELISDWLYFTPQRHSLME